MSNQMNPSKLLMLKTYFVTFTGPLRWPVEFWQTRQENLAFEAGLETAWSYCAGVWNRSYIDAWCQLLSTPRRPKPPRTARILMRFHEQFGQNQEFILKQAQSANPVLVAYAVQLLADPTQLPAKARNRSEAIRLRDWHHEVEMSLGDWIGRLIERHNRAEEI